MQKGELKSLSAAVSTPSLASPGSWTPLQDRCGKTGPGSSTKPRRLGGPSHCSKEATKHPSQKYSVLIRCECVVARCSSRARMNFPTDLVEAPTTEKRSRLCETYDAARTGQYLRLRNPEPAGYFKKSQYNQRADQWWIAMTRSNGLSAITMARSSLSVIIMAWSKFIIVSRRACDNNVAVRWSQKSGRYTAPRTIGSVSARRAMILRSDAPRSENSLTRSFSLVFS
jgi:hypothetical protein